MPLVSHLQFGDNHLAIYNRDYLVKDIKCNFKRHFDEFHPVSPAMCDSIEVTVFAPGKKDPYLLDWFINNSSENGRIIVGQSDPYNDAAPEWKKILFYDAQCFSITENYLIDDKRRTLTLKFVALNVIIDDSVFQLNDNS